MTRDDHRTGTDRVAEVAEREAADLYVNIQGDEPLIDPGSITAAVAPFLDGQTRTFEVTNLMTPVRRMSDLSDSTVPKVVVNDSRDAVFLSRLPIPYPKDNRDFDYYKQVCVYTFTPEALRRFTELSSGPSERAEGIELLRFIEHGITVRMVMVENDTVAVDTPGDVELVLQRLRA
jgi:3-deoxy-manno-octulosonate cytidylyltransferase (CMP-KDO synthetase)